ncbi:2-oxoglutarate dehydrogenase E1 subunit family protein, partial [Desertimonas flava]
MTTTSDSSFGANSWLVDEMHEQFLDDPQSVSESWREFFEGYRGRAGAAADGAPAKPADVTEPAPAVSSVVPPTSAPAEPVAATP